MDYEKSHVKSNTETSQYEVQRSVEGVLAAASEGLRSDMSNLPKGVLPGILCFYSCFKMRV